MTRRSINLGNGCCVSLGGYVRAWKQAKTLPPETGVKIVPGQWWPGTVADVLRELNYGLHDRINRHDPGYGCGRKWASDWWRSARHTANAVNMPRVIVRPPQIPMEFRARLAHRLTWPDDE